MHTISSTDCFADLSAGSSTSWHDIAGQSLRLVALWRERARQRQALAALDERLLRDIGVTCYEAEQECNKPFWR
jgi:uncharacterized protein YjiS (DUF1127 family)